MFPAKSTGFHGNSTGSPRVHLTKSHWCHKLTIKGINFLKKHDPWSFRSVQKYWMHRPPWLKSWKTPVLGVRPMQNMKDTVPSCWCRNIYELYSYIYIGNSCLFIPKHLLHVLNASAGVSRRRNVSKVVPYLAIQILTVTLYEGLGSNGTHSAGIARCFPRRK